MTVKAKVEQSRKEPIWSGWPKLTKPSPTLGGSIIIGMKTALNLEQTDKLSDFFFDIAKGIVLGILGFSVSFTDI